MEEFLSSEWLDANLFNAESMPDDHPVTITGKEWFDLLMEINALRKRRDSALSEILADQPPSLDEHQAEHVGFMQAKTHAMEIIAGIKE